MDYRGQSDARRIDRKLYLYNEPNRASFPEKPYLNRIKKPYRKPTQVDKRKYAKVNGLNLVKELGKSVAVSSQYGLPWPQGLGLQQTYFNRLFIKNTALC